MILDWLSSPMLVEPCPPPFSVDMFLPAGSVYLCMLACMGEAYYQIAYLQLDAERFCF